MGKYFFAAPWSWTFRSQLEIDDLSCHQCSVRSLYAEKTPENIMRSWTEAKGGSLYSHYQSACLWLHKRKQQHVFTVTVSYSHKTCGHRVFTPQDCTTHHRRPRTVRNIAETFVSCVFVSIAAFCLTWTKLWPRPCEFCFKAESCRTIFASLMYKYICLHVCVWQSPSVISADSSWDLF